MRERLLSSSLSVLCSSVTPLLFSQFSRLSLRFLHGFWFPLTRVGVISRGYLYLHLVIEIQVTAQTNTHTHIHASPHATSSLGPKESLGDLHAMCRYTKSKQCMRTRVCKCVSVRCGEPIVGSHMCLPLYIAYTHIPFYMHVL